MFASLVVLVSGGLTTFSFSFSSDTVGAVPSLCGAAASMSSCKSLDALLNVMISASCLMSSTILFASLTSGGQFGLPVSILVLA